MKIFSKELVVSLLTVTVSGFMGITNANAQEFTVQGDLVSSYVWHGKIGRASCRERVYVLV